VFNVEQIKGLPEIYYAKAEKKLTPVERIASAEEFFAATKAVINYGGNRAYYAAGPDRIQMPPIEAFRDAESFYATLAHETTHWTKHESRLQRDFGRKTWGDEGYAREELVAELGSAFLCADLAATPEPWNRSLVVTHRDQLDTVLLVSGKTLFYAVVQSCTNIRDCWPCIRKPEAPC
jgi:antirestriction protein ArdC